MLRFCLGLIMFFSIAIPAFSQPRYCGAGLDFRNPSPRVLDWIKEHKLKQVYAISKDSVKTDTTLLYEFVVKGDTLIYRSFEPLDQSHYLRKYDRHNLLFYTADSFGPILTGKIGFLERYYDSLGRETQEVLRNQKSDGAFEAVHNQRSTYTKNGNVERRVTDSSVVITYSDPNGQIDSIAFHSADRSHQILFDRRYYDRLGRLTCETGESTNAGKFSIDSFYYHSNGIRSRSVSYLIDSDSFVKQRDEVFDTCGNETMSFERTDTVIHCIQYDLKKRPTLEITSMSSHGEILKEAFEWAENDLLISYKILGKKGKPTFEQHFIYNF